MSRRFPSLRTTTRRLVRRPALHFAVIGAALFVARGLVGDSGEIEVIDIPRARVEQLDARYLAETGLKPTPAELRKLVEEEVDDQILYREALRRGFERSDPIVRARLVRDMRFVSTAAGSAGNGRAREIVPSGQLDRAAAPTASPARGTGDPLPSDDELFMRALELGLARSDLVVHRRLVQRMKFELEATATTEKATDSKGPLQLPGSAARRQPPSPSTRSSSTVPVTGIG
jgi:hypothetical protein